MRFSPGEKYRFAGSQNPPHDRFPNSLSLMKILPLAAQLYTVRQACQKDFAGTLKAVAKIGYRAVELAGFYGVPAVEARRLLDEANLMAVGAHFPMDRLRNDVQGVVDECHALGVHHVVCSGPGTSAYSDAKAWRGIGGMLDGIGLWLKQKGLTLCYHNHAFEFEKFEGRPVLDWLLDGCSAENVAAELDVYWIKKGGEDPAAWMERLGARCVLLHLKDFGGDGEFAEVGTGTLDFGRILATARKCGVRGFIVEQDTCKGPPLESLAVSFENLRRLAPDLL